MASSSSSSANPRVIFDQRKRRFFGVPLPDLALRQSGHRAVPFELVQAIDLLLQKLGEPGLFKIFTSSPTLVRQLESGKFRGFEPDTSPHALAYIIVRFLLFLPKPLLFGFENGLLSAAEQLKSSRSRCKPTAISLGSARSLSDASSSDCEEDLEPLRACIRALPLPARATLDQLCLLLHQLHRNSEYLGDSLPSLAKRLAFPIFLQRLSPKQARSKNVFFDVQQRAPHDAPLLHNDTLADLDAAKDSFPDVAPGLYDQLAKRRKHFRSRVQAIDDWERRLPALLALLIEHHDRLFPLPERETLAFRRRLFATGTGFHDIVAAVHAPQIWAVTNRHVHVWHAETYERIARFSNSATSATSSSGLPTVALPATATVTRSFVRLFAHQQYVVVLSDDLQLSVYCCRDDDHQLPPLLLRSVSVPALHCFCSGDGTHIYAGSDGSVVIIDAAKSKPASIIPLSSIEGLPSELHSLPVTALYVDNKFNRAWAGLSQGQYFCFQLSTRKLCTSSVKAQMLFANRAPVRSILPVHQAIWVLAEDSLHCYGALSNVLISQTNFADSIVKVCHPVPSAREVLALTSRGVILFIDGNSAKAIESKATAHHSATGCCTVWNPLHACWFLWNSSLDASVTAYALPFAREPPNIPAPPPLPLQVKKRSYLRASHLRDRVDETDGSHRGRLAPFAAQCNQSESIVSSTTEEQPASPAQPDTSPSAFEPIDTVVESSATGRSQSTLDKNSTQSDFSSEPSHLSLRADSSSRSKPPRRLRFPRLSLRRSKMDKEADSKQTPSVPMGSTDGTAALELPKPILRPAIRSTSTKQKVERPRIRFLEVAGKQHSLLALQQPQDSSFL